MRVFQLENQPGSNDKNLIQCEPLHWYVQHWAQMPGYMVPYWRGQTNAGCDLVAILNLSHKMPESYMSRNGRFVYQLDYESKRFGIKDSASGDLPVVLLWCIKRSCAEYIVRSLNWYHEQYTEELNMKASITYSDKEFVLLVVPEPVAVVHRDNAPGCGTRITPLPYPWTAMIGGHPNFWFTGKTEDDVWYLLRKYYEARMYLGQLPINEELKRAKAEAERLKELRPIFEQAGLSDRLPSVGEG